ncbi:MAG: DNA repair protein RecO, partial [Pseudomonadota bacterium]|nr:DNA repair protein RecO [Pseudomonadota bacterium]
MIKQDIGYILHARAYRETSQIVDVLTQYHGRQQMVVKGIRQKKGMQSGLQLFQCYELQFSGRSELKQLRLQEAISERVQLSQQALFCGFYINELVTRLVPVDDVSQVFEHYQDCLCQLPSQAHEPLLRAFEFHLLDDLGYSYDFTADIFSQPILPQSHYEFVFEQGFRASADPWAMTFSGEALQAFEQRDFSVF